MPFDFFGARAKVVIAMAHIGALPGTPLYDADGGMDGLIEGVARDVENCRKAACTRSCSATKTIAPIASRRPRRASLR